MEHLIKLIIIKLHRRHPPHHTLPRRSEPGNIERLLVVPIKVSLRIGVKGTSVPLVVLLVLVFDLLAVLLALVGVLKMEPTL